MPRESAGGAFFDGAHERFRIEGLGDESAGSVRQNGMPRLLLTVGRQHHDRHGWYADLLLIAADGGDGVETVHDRHVEVHEDDVVAAFASPAGDGFHRRLAVADDVDPMPGL